MSFALKTTPQTILDVAPQHKKLNVLIDQIEQQKRLLLAWQQAQDEIRAYSQKALMPAYRELYSTLYAQMQTLWNSLNLYGLSKTDTVTIEDKIQALTRLLQGSQLLTQQQMNEVQKMHAYYMQANEYTKKKNKQKNRDSFPEVESLVIEDELDDWNNDPYKQEREQAKLKRAQDKQAKAAMLVNQSLKTLYLKIASI